MADFHRAAIGDGGEKVRCKNIDGVRIVTDWLFYRCGLGIVSSVVLFLVITMTVTMTVVHVPMGFMFVTVLDSTSNMEMSSPVAVRWVRSRTV